MLVLLNGGAEPLLALRCEIIMCQERNCEWNVRLGRCEIAVDESLVEDVEGSAATGFFEVGRHASNGVDFQVCVATTTQLFCCFEGCRSMFGKIPEQGEGVMFCGGVQVGFSKGLLSQSQSSKQALVCG